MQLAKLSCLAFLFLFISCKKQANDELNAENLAGRWEAKDLPESVIMFNNFYSNAFELRKNGEFQLYYWHVSPPNPVSTGTQWTLSNEQELMFNYGPGSETCTITQFDGKTMTIEHALSGERYKMTRE